MEYKASLDILSKALTVGVFILLIAIGQKNVRELFAAHGDLIPTLIHGGVLLLFLAIIAGSYLYSTNRYLVTNSQLVIKRPIGDRVISIADITETRAVEKTEFSGTIRTFGNGGLFGYYGKFYNAKLGKMTWYVTQDINRILILTKQGEKIIISPDDISLLDKIQTARHATSKG
jgi:hypothetical protein